MYTSTYRCTHTETHAYTCLHTNRPMYTLMHTLRETHGCTHNICMYTYTHVQVLEVGDRVPLVPEYALWISASGLSPLGGKPLVPEFPWDSEVTFSHAPPPPTLLCCVLRERRPELLGAASQDTSQRKAEWRIWPVGGSWEPEALLTTCHLSPPT